MKNVTLFCTLLVLLAACSPKKNNVDFEKLEEPAKRLPENAVYGMEVAPGCEVTLFASEPMLINPTNLHIDERGRVWVCEALNYRNTHNPENPVREKGDRILILEDTDGDAKADKSTVFYQGTDVNAALGIWVTNNHAIVSCSPYVFLLSDTNGDDIADTKDTLFTGLGGEQSDHAIHSFVQGADGKLYFNFGNNGQQIMDRHGKPVIDLSGNTVNNKGTPYRQGMVFRCDADGSNLEVLAHNFRNNYEVAVDSYGTLWQSDNDDDGNMGVRINYVMEYGNYGFTDQVTGAWWGERRVNLEAEIPKRHWHLNDPGVIPNLLQTGSGSPCGMAVYEGDMLPQIFQNQALHAEAGHNVVRAYPAQVDGAGYKAQIVNLLKSKDQWVRPSDVCVAPDGSVFISDWYDPAVGGHKFGDTGRGRIFRVSAGKKGRKYNPAKSIAGFETEAQLLESLKNPNLAVQAKAADALRRKGNSVEAGLKKLWENDPNPRIRARALWILAKMKGKAQTYVQAALKDKDADLRIVGLRLARQVLPNQLAQLVKSVVKDPSTQVRREAAITLRFVVGPAADQLWADLATQYNGKDRWYLEALGIGADLYADARLAAWKSKVGSTWNNAAGRNIVWRSRSREVLPLLKEMILNPKVTPFDLRQYLRALHFQTDPSKNELIESLVNADHPLRDSINILSLFVVDPAYFQKSGVLKTLAEQVLPRLEGKVEYLDLLARLQLKNQNPKLLQMALQSSDGALRGQAASLLVANGGMGLLLQQLNGADDAKAQQILYALAPVSNPALYKLDQQYLTDPKNSLSLRRAALSCLTSTGDGQTYLLNMLKQNQVPEELVMQGLVSLSGAWDTDIRKNSRALLTKKQKEMGNSLPPVAVLEGRTGKLASGKAVFSQQCATCHQVGGAGTNFGPALTEIGAKLDKGALYKAIIYPSSGINYGYEGFNVALKDGSTVQGIVESKTASELTLRIMGGTSRKYPMAEVLKMEELPQSLMTEGLYRAFTEQQLVDLVEYLATLKPKESL